MSKSLTPTPRHSRFGVRLQRPFGTILRDGMAIGLGDPKRRPIKQQNVADALGLNGVDAVGNWVRGKGFPEKGRFDRLCRFLSEGESDPLRLLIIDELRDAYDQRRRASTVKLATPIGNFNFDYSPKLGAVAIVLAALPVGFLFWQSIDDGPEDPSQAVISLKREWEDSESSTGKAWRTIRFELAQREDQILTLLHLIERLAHEEAMQARDRFVTGLIDGGASHKGLREELDEVIGFFDVAMACVEARHCPKDDIATYFGGPADKLWQNFHAYIQARHFISPDYGAGMKAIATWHVQVSDFEK